MDFVKLVDAYGRTMHKDMPPIMVAHPVYGELGSCEAKGFIPKRGKRASTRAILRDSNRNTVKMLRNIEAKAPAFVMAAIAAALARDPLALPYVLGAISTYDGIVAARGGGSNQDIWMSLIVAVGGVTTAWYDLCLGSWTPGSVPSVTGYVHNATGGAVLDSTDNGSWLTDPAGTNRKYIVSCGLTTSSISGFALGMLLDYLWAGQYLITSNTTINPTTDVEVTRYAAALANGNRMMAVLASTLTHTGAATITTTYTNEGGTAGRTSISITPATGLLNGRVVFNTIHSSATVVASSPFMPMTNNGDAGVRTLEQVQIAGGTVTAGTINHKIVRPLIIMPFIAANSYIEQDSTLNIGNMVELVNVSQVCGCLSWVVFTGGTSTATMSSFLRTVEG